ncbi:hypothetical protein OQA88_6622 [Cercophora sp. LCS_1]
MKLTPLKVKGKGPRPKPWAPPDPDRKRKYNADADGGATRQRRRLKKLAGAPIERLPTELLELIFHFSENMNFPCSSLRIGWLLSSKSFLTELIVSAFGPTWDCWFGLEVDQIKPHELKTVKGNPVYQRAVLDRKWFTLDLLLDAEKIWYRKRHGQEPDPETLIGPWVSNKIDYYKNYAQTLKDMAANDDDHRGLNVRAEAETEAVETTFKKNQDMLSKRSADMHPGVAVPDRLLVAPFTWDKAGLLLWVVQQRHAGNLSPNQTWERTIPAFKDGIMMLEDRGLAFTMVMLYSRLGVFHNWPVSIIREYVSWLLPPPGVESDAITDFTNALIDKVWDFGDRGTY